jgi:acyl carrier protein
MNAEPQIFNELVSLLREYSQQEYSRPIVRETRLYGDMGLVSIDAVVIGEQLQTHFGRALPFNKFIADLGQRGAQDLTVGELADFLQCSLSATGTGSA